MKNVILALVIFLGVLLNCTPANAQYAYNPPKKGQPTLLDNPVYKNAKWKVKSGKRLFYIGLGIQAAGATMMLLVPAIEDGELGDVLLEIFPYHGNSDYPTRICNLAQGFTDFGALLAATGIVLETIGGIRWLNGSAKIKDLKFEYVMKGNGILIQF
jgi:hypothetical protein